jgi:hypothetical protein
MMSSPRRGTLAVSCFVLLLTPLGAAQLCGQISARGVGPFHLCDTLARVSSVFPSARDTTPAEAERSSTLWGRTELSLSGIAKVVRLARDEWVLFETQSIDSVHVWRIRTNSPTYQTPHGYRVGMSAIDLLNSGAHLEVLAPIGVLYLEADSVSFLVDDSSAHAFWDRYDSRKPASVAVKLLSPNARIKELLIASPCEE